MILVLVVSWLRFFMYFLLIKPISQVLLTLYEMLSDTLSFILVLICYFLLVSSVFTTLFQDVHPEKYGGFVVSARSLFDSAMAVYDYKGMGEGGEEAYSVLQIVHIFFSNILLFNFLIAILSFTFESMQKLSNFKYKANVYKYSERFLAAFESGPMGELIVHPPPVNLLTLLLVPWSGLD